MTSPKAASHPLPSPTRPEPRQLTVRAVLAGMAIGAVMCAANVYVVFKTGWSLGVTLSSTVIAFGLFRALGTARLVRRPLGLLENTTVSSVASAAAFMTGGGNMAALPALLMLTGSRPSGSALVVWFAVIAALGVVVAIPVKRQILDVDRLPFPLGTATAVTLQAMHGSAEGGATDRTSSRLFRAAAVAGLFTLLRDLRALPARLPEMLVLPVSLAGHPARAWSLGVDFSLVLFGGGALMAPRTAWSLLVGGWLTFGALAPAMAARGVITTVEYKSIVAFTVWPGAALLVASGVFAILLEWRSALAAVRDLASALGRSARTRAGVRGDPEQAPLHWFGLGVAVLSPVAVVLMSQLFGIPWWAGVLAIPLALVMGVIAGRVTGETDISPTKALGPVTQLLYGVLAPGHLTANLMSANVIGGVGLHAGDLLTDLKAGQLVGASPRRQVVAQLFGVVVGALAVVPAFVLLVPDASAIGTPSLPAPAVLVWASVSRALAGGLDGIPSAARIAAAIGAALGVALTSLERWLPERRRRWLPSPAGLGMAMVIPASTSAAMFLGSMIAWFVRRARPRSGEAITPVASGLVAGESVLGMAIALARAFGLPV